MNKSENLFVIAMEECAEVQQAISKLLRFGPDGCNPTEPGETNAYRVMVEFQHLQAVILMLQAEGELPNLSLTEDLQIREDKISKVTRYLDVSRYAGRLTDG